MGFSTCDWFLVLALSHSKQLILACVVFFVLVQCHLVQFAVDFPENCFEHEVLHFQWVGLSIVIQMHFD